MFVRKITVKQVCAANPDIVAVRAAGDAGLFVMRVLGKAEQIISRDSPYENGEGEKRSYGLKGQFIAWNPAQAQYESVTAFLPGAIHDAIAFKLKEPETEEVEFGFDIYAIPSPRDPNKYEFASKPFVQLQASNPFEHLLKLAPAIPAGNQPSLPMGDSATPKPAEKPAKAPAKKSAKKR